jgi:hypothetical protein
MSTVTLSETTYQWLQRKAEESARTPDQVADELLRRQLVPEHAYIEVVEKITGSQAMIKGTQVYDALSYYHDHQDEIEQEMIENTEEYGRTYLREHLGEEGYLHVTGQAE